MIAVFSEQEWDFMSISASAAGIDGAEENSEDEHDIRMVVGRERDGRRRRNAVCVQTTCADRTSRSGPTVGLWKFFRFVCQ